jgi:hypothetical protein
MATVPSARQGAFEGMLAWYVTPSSHDRNGNLQLTTVNAGLIARKQTSGMKPPLVSGAADDRHVD